MLHYLQTAHVHELSHIGLRCGNNTGSNGTEVTAFTARLSALCKPVQTALAKCPTVNCTRHTGSDLRQQRTPGWHDYSHLETYLTILVNDARHNTLSSTNT